MNRRQVILKLITLDVAENGKLSKHGLRLYVENRVSWQAIQPYIRAGQAIYAAKKEKTAPAGPRPSIASTRNGVIAAPAHLSL